MLLSASTTAETLLADWESQAQPSHSPDYPTERARLLRHFTPLCAAFVHYEADVNIEEEDVRTVLRHATSLRVGTIGASGPGRAMWAAQQVAAVAQAHHLGPEPTGPATMALLTILSHPTAELEMDELTGITEYLQQNLGDQQLEVIFGHDVQADLPTEIWVGVLLSYCSRPLPPAPVPLLQPAPPEIDAATGRDFYFDAAARLFVQRRRAAGSLIQRRFGLGYNRTCRLLDKLAAADIITPDPFGSGWRLLVTDKAMLDGLLAQLG
ncbi:hypothetical protein J7E24_06895 [Hymenobacter sp. ISL-91]|uniref:DNA translocase FtsK n=1 Tax=Hymenobacter sp. ISL-91 TaxID=2819151 RepID=UPI001BE9E2F4|nr:DNA translocase FtsK [Hymenobacter sp. ISL-91]MBT2557506.1 hypothetical protein [Hymenobacter sp. ISL-91]